MRPKETVVEALAEEALKARRFPDIARRWAEASRSHAGLIIAVGIDHPSSAPACGPSIGA
jgi:hypothetical protein